MERAAAFFKAIFDAEEIYSCGDRVFSLSREKFFLIGGQWIAVMGGASLAERTYNHAAFKIREEEFDLYESKVRALNVDLKPARTRVEGEGRSLYFYDYDNHLFELHTGVLSERLEFYGRGIKVRNDNI